MHFDSQGCCRWHVWKHVLDTHLYLSGSCLLEAAISKWKAKGHKKSILDTGLYCLLQSAPMHIRLVLPCVVLRILRHWTWHVMLLQSRDLRYPRVMQVLDLCLLCIWPLSRKVPRVEKRHRLHLMLFLHNQSADRLQHRPECPGSTSSQPQNEAACPTVEAHEGRLGTPAASRSVGQFSVIFYGFNLGYFEAFNVARCGLAVEATSSC